MNYLVLIVLLLFPASHRHERNTPPKVARDQAVPSTTVLWTTDGNNPPYTVVYSPDENFDDPESNGDPGSTKRVANETGNVKVYDKDGTLVEDRTVHTGDYVVEDRPTGDPDGGIQQVSGIRPGGI